MGLSLTHLTHDVSQNGLVTWKASLKHRFIQKDLLLTSVWGTLYVVCPPGGVLVLIIILKTVLLEWS